MTTKSEALGYQLINLAQQPGKSTEAIAEEIIGWADSLSPYEFCEVCVIAEKIAAERDARE
jgi:hypothetical protein